MHSYLFGALLAHCSTGVFYYLLCNTTESRQGGRDGETWVVHGRDSNCSFLPWNLLLVCLNLHPFFCVFWQVTNRNARPHNWRRCHVQPQLRKPQDPKHEGAIGRSARMSCVVCAACAVSVCFFVSICFELSVADSDPENSATPDRPPLRLSTV